MAVPLPTKVLMSPATGPGLGDAAGSPVAAAAAGVLDRENLPPNSRRLNASADQASGAIIGESPPPPTPSQDSNPALRPNIPPEARAAAMRGAVAEMGASDTTGVDSAAEVGGTFAIVAPPADDTPLVTGSPEEAGSPTVPRLTAGRRPSARKSVAPAGKARVRSGATAAARAGFGVPPGLSAAGVLRAGSRPCFATRGEPATGADVAPRPAATRSFRVRGAGCEAPGRP